MIGGSLLVIAVVGGSKCAGRKHLTFRITDAVSLASALKPECRRGVRCIRFVRHHVFLLLSPTPSS